MMKVNSVSTSADRAGRYRVCFEDGVSMRLYRQTVQDFSLYPGKELDSEEMQRLEAAVGEMSAKMRAVRIMSASSVSKKDLEQRLIHKGEDPENAKKAVDWMSSLDLIDDRKTAEQIVSRCIYKGYGEARAKQELYEKRIPKNLWEDVLLDYPDQTDAIRSFLVNRLGDSTEPAQQRKAIDALLRRGHSYSTIKRVLSDLQTETDFFLEEE